MPLWLLSHQFLKWVQPHPSSPCTPHRCQGCQASRYLSTRGCSNRGSSDGTRSCLPTSFTPDAQFTFSPCFHPSRGSPPVVQCWPSPCTFPLCCSASTSLSGFALVVAARLLCLPLCSTGYCDSHCHSPRCPQHRPSVLQPIPLVGSSRPARPPRTCRVSGCSSPPHTNCSVGFCSTHCTSRGVSDALLLLYSPHCRRPGCLDLAPPDCPVGFCNLHCTNSRCLVHDPLSLSGNGRGAVRR